LTRAFQFGVQPGNRKNEAIVIKKGSHANWKKVKLIVPSVLFWNQTRAGGAVKKSENGK